MTTRSKRHAPWAPDFTAPPVWADRLEGRLQELTRLAVGWDGYAGAPVSPACADFATGLLRLLYRPGVPAPDLVPGGDGSLQIEWHLNGYDLEIDILAPDRVTAFRCDLLSQNEEELELQHDFAALVPWIADLGKDRGTATA